MSILLVFPIYFHFVLQMYNIFFTYANLFSNFQGKHANLNKKRHNLSIVPLRSHLPSQI